MDSDPLADYDQEQDIRAAHDDGAEFEQPIQPAVNPEELLTRMRDTRPRPVVHTPSRRLRPRLSAQSRKLLNW